MKGSTVTGLLQWVAGGAIGLVASVALAFSNSTSTQISEVKTVSARHDTEIALLKQSICINNQNQINMGKRLQVEVVTDGNCSK